MALITCPECGKEISSTVSKCPHCGYEVKKEEKVTILGYSESFVIAPSVSVYLNDWKIGEVSRNGKIELDLDKGSYLKFKGGLRSTSCVVKPGDWVLLSFNRVTGGLDAILTDKDNYQSAIIKTKGTDSKRWIWIVIIAAALIALGYLLDFLTEVRYIKHEAAKAQTEMGIAERFTTQSQRIEREEEKANAKSLESMREISSHPWKRVIAGDPYGKCILEVLYFNENGQGTCYEEHYAGGNKVTTPYNKNPSSFDFSYYIDGEKVFCEGTWEYVFKDGKLYDKENHLYKEGANLMYY